VNLDESTTCLIRECLIRVIDPEKIFIFGSYARGEAHDDSDVDIAVIVSAEKATWENRIQCRDVGTIACL
jgi:predicted nucleotidyltransferase